MFIVYMKFGANKSRASELMEEHVLWIQRGIDDGAFLLAGSLAERQGGVILAYGIDRDALEQRLKGDPFVRHGVVTLEITDVAVTKAQERASFLTSDEAHRHASSEKANSTDDEPAPRNH